MVLSNRLILILGLIKYLVSHFKQLKVMDFLTWLLFGNWAEFSPFLHPFFLIENKNKERDIKF